MVSKDGFLKLIDFGCSKQFKKTVNTITRLAVTQQWTAPEVLKEVGVGVSADIWSLGCTVYEMVS